MDLTASVSELAFIGPAYKKRLEKLQIQTIKDLLYHVPNRYLDFSRNVPINNLQIGDIVTIKGKLTFLKNQYTKSGKNIQIGEIKDQYGKLTIVWFNQPFLTRVLYPDDNLSLAGKIDWFGRTPAMISPEYEKSQAGLHTGRLIPIYPETAGLSSKWLRSRIKSAYDANINQITEFLPYNILKKYHLIGESKAITSIHFPSNLNEALEGRKRLGFDELLFLHLKSYQRKHTWHQYQSIQKISLNQKLHNAFSENLPFELTKAQKRVVCEIISDLTKASPMNRLLEGDVGSGKTVVAAIACFTTFYNGYQSVIMAPTQILAQQHFNTFKQIFVKQKIRISLITSSKKSIEDGKSDIVIGTHALLHHKNLFENCAFVVIDEQHKFGVKQRTQLITKSKGKNKSPHVLTMTATPIPRTVALTSYGDLDLSILDELPKGRITPHTWIVPSTKRQASYLWIKEKIQKENIQAFVICPLIEESEIETMLDVKAVTTEYQKLQKVFKNLKVGLLHGRLKEKEKDKIVKAFRSGKIDILVSTPVVEVGIDIPNANIMLVEAAERFGLAQLHQLRGRIGRGGKPSFFMVFPETNSLKVQARLKALKNESSGFKLAEIDLQLRGPGEIFGTAQHGFPELKIASWYDITLIKDSKKASEEIIKNPKNLKKILEITFPQNQYT